jgi:hypothetical protein
MCGEHERRAENANGVQTCDVRESGRAAGGEGREALMIAFALQRLLGFVTSGGCAEQIARNSQLLPRAQGTT